MSSSYSPPQPEAYEDKWVTIKKSLLILAGAAESGGLGGGGLSIPGGSTSFTVAYYGSTNNIQTVTYSNGSLLTLTYVGGGAADDDLIQTATVS